MLAAEVQYPLRTKRKRETRSRIIQSALDLLSLNEPTDVTMAMVSDKAGIHVTTLFTHFDSRQALFTALSEPIIEELRVRIEANKGHVPFFDFLREIQKEFAASVTSSKGEMIAQALYVQSQFELLPAWLNFEKSQVEMYAAYLVKEYGITKLQGRLVGGMIVSATIYSFQNYLQNQEQDLDSIVEGNIHQIETIINKGLFSD